MRILFVAFPDSIHTVRWIRQLEGTGWEVYLFPSADVPVIHDEMPSFVSLFVPLYMAKHPIWFVRKNRRGDFFVALCLLFVYLLLKTWCRICGKKDHLRYLHFPLKLLIRLKRPEVIHSLETQNAGYLVADIKKKGGGKFPVWVHTNWGSDLYLFGRLEKHRKKVTEVLSSCDHYLCECQRDITLAKSFGYTGPLYEPYPNTGGFDLVKVGMLRGKLRPSQRKIVLVKGYQHWAGRALTALRALELCADALRGYEVWLYSVQSEAVAIKAELFSQTTGISTQVLPLDSSHEAVLDLFSRSRIYLGLSIADAISTSLLEAIVTGAFPIQSCTSCADEWIVDGETGFVVPPEDPEKVAIALRRALTDDVLVDRAAELNWERNRERFDGKILAQKTIQFYTSLSKTERKEHGNVY